MPKDYTSNIEAYRWPVVLLIIALKVLTKTWRKKRRKFCCLSIIVHHMETFVTSQTYKVNYLPANTTLKLQPLDQSIIQRFKMHNREKLQVPTTIDVLQTVWMVAKSLHQVSEETITKFFKRSGFKVPFDDEEDDLPLVQLNKT